MWKTNYFLRNINVLNMLLAALSAVMFFVLAYPLMNADIKVDIPKAKEITVKKAENVAAENVPTSLDYVIVPEKNLFHPERKIPSTDKKEEQVVVRPEIIFYGAIITSEKKIAYIEDKKNPYSTPGRGNRQTPFAQGAMIGGYTLKEVNPESIVLVRGEDKMVVNLRDQKDRKPGETTGKSQMPPGQMSAGQMHTPPPIPRPSGPSSAMPPIPARPVINNR